MSIRSESERRVHRGAMGALLAAALAWPGAWAAPAFVVVPDSPVHGVVVVPDPQDVVELYSATVAGSIEGKVDAWKASAAGLLLGQPVTAEPAYFRAVYEDGRSVTVGERNLSGALQRNWRDLGGYETEDGRRVRPGILFRSGRLDGLNAEEQSLLSTLGLRSLCDFRTAAEVEEMPNPPLNGVHEIAGCSDQSSADITQQLHELLQQPDREAVDWKKVMVGSYQNMGERYENQFQAFFAGLTQEDSLPMLFRCTGGKDRTGVAAALLLLALGVPEEIVIADYHLSELDPVGPFESEVFPRELLNQPALSAADPAYLQSALDGIRSRYGSVEKYLDRIGVDAQVRASLRDRLLTSE